MGFLDQISTIATTVIAPGVVDNIGKSGPLMAALRKNCSRVWEGPSIQENILYGLLNGQSYSPGANFNINQKQVATGGTFYPRYYVVPVPIVLEKALVEMTGPTAKFDHVDLQLQAAAITMGAMLAVDCYKHGQNVTTDRTTKINGLEEAYNDGTNAGPVSASAFSTYGTLTRNAEVDAALNSPMTSPTANFAGAPITMSALEQAWQSVAYGTEKCDLITCSNLAYSYIKTAFASQQRFESTDGQFGFKSIAFNGSEIIADRYAPGTYSPTTDESNILGMAALSYETIWFHNTKYLRFYISNQPLMAFGLEPFVPANDSSVAVAKYRFAGTLTSTSNRMGRVLFGIGA